MEKDSEQKLVIYWNWQKLLSLICAILIVPTLIVFLFSATLKKTVINPNFYKNSFKKADAYNRLINDGVPSLIMDSDIGSGVITSPFAKSLVVFVLQKSIDPVWIENLTNAAIDQIVKIFSAYSSSAPEVNLDLKDAKTYLTKVSDGLLILSQLVPTCAQAQGIASCQQTNVNLDQIKAQIGDIRTKIDDISVSSIDIGSQVYQANSYIITLQKFIRGINDFFFGSLVILLILILAIVGLEYRKLATMLKFISLPLVIGSVIGFLVMWPIKSLALGNLGSLDLQLPAAMNKIIADIIKANIAGIFQKFELCAGIILGIFVIIYVMVIILERTNNKFLKQS